VKELPPRQRPQTPPGVPYHDADLRSYLRAVWGRVKLDPDPSYWARRYAGTTGLSVDG
jgi:hypothetical protein